MAFGDYTTLANVKAELGIADTKDDARITRLITAVSRAIDNWCQVPSMHFVGKAETRFYDVGPDFEGPIRGPENVWFGGGAYGPNGPYGELGYSPDATFGLLAPNAPTIFIDPMVSIPAEVAVDSSEDGSYATIMVYLTDYDVWPANAQIDGQYYMALRWLPATAVNSFSVGPRAMRVKSIFGVRPPSNTIQTLQITGAPTGGTFTLTYGGQESAPIAYNAAAQDVEAALTNMSSLATLSGNYPGTTTLIVSDGNLPNDTLTISVTDKIITGISLGSNNLTGGTAPTVDMGAATYSGPGYPADLEQAAILTIAKWMMEPKAAPMGMLSSPDFGIVKVGPHPTVMEILVDGGYIEPWLAL